MTTTLIVLGSVATFLVGWFYVARYRVHLWRKRGDRILANSTGPLTRRFDTPSDRPWIAFYALLVTFVWPLMLPMLVMSDHLFTKIDERDERERKIREARAAEVKEWESIRRNATTDDERRVAQEILNGLREET